MDRKIHCQHYDAEKGQDTISYREKNYSSRNKKCDCKCIKCGEIFNLVEPNAKVCRNKAVMYFRNTRDMVNTMKFCSAAMGKEIPYKYTELLNILETFPEDIEQIFTEYNEFEQSKVYEKQSGIFDVFKDFYKSTNPAVSNYTQKILEANNDNK